mgnify:CR=1 FL=1|jgi:hypothetical protein
MARKKIRLIDLVNKVTFKPKIAILSPMLLSTNSMLNLSFLWLPLYRILLLELIRLGQVKYL